MNSPFLSSNLLDSDSVPREGELFKVISLYGRSFLLYYGYYDECERNNPTVDPMPIYPNFIQEPVYTEDGFAFVTKMQDPCIHYSGKTGKFNECAECRYYLHGEELLGICTCPKNKKGYDLEGECKQFGLPMNNKEVI